MIFIAILIHVLGNLSPKWILKENFEKGRNNYSWNSSFLKLSGLLTSFLFTLILISTLTLTSKDKFIENNKAIYGLEYSETMKKLGFEDGYQIVSINDQEIDRVSNIIKRIVLETGDAKVLVSKNNTVKELILTDGDKLTIMQSRDLKHIKAKMQPDTILSKDFEKVKMTVTNFGVIKIFETFGMMWKQVILLISPRTSAYNQIGGFVTISQVQDFRGYLFILALSSMFIGILNFLPLPGFSIGNLVISVIENSKKKHFNKKIMNVLRIISISLVIAFILINIYL